MPATIESPPAVLPVPTVDVPATQVAPEAPPSSSKDYNKLNVNYDDFQKLMGEVISEDKPPKKVEDAPAAEPKEEVTPPVEPPAEVSKEEPPKEEPIVVPQQVGKTIHAKTGENRDYAGIDPSHVPAFKRMSNEAFNIMKPIYTERDQLKRAISDKDTKIAELSTKGYSLPESYYSHPDAFVLSPEFRQNQLQHEFAQRQSQHWHRQLVAIEAGNPVKDLQQDQQGNLQEGPLIEVDDANRAELKAAILSHLSNASAEERSRYSALTSYAQNFRYRAEQLQAFVRDQEKRIFPQYEDPKYKGWEYGNALVNALPAEFKSNLLTGMLARMFGVIQELRTKLTSLQNTQQSQAQLNNEQQLAGPAPSNFSGARASGKSKITYEMFQNL